MDVDEFGLLTARVVKTRNVESRAFLQAFDVKPGKTTGWSEDAAAKWRMWTAANEGLRGAVAQLEAFLGAAGLAAH